VQLRGTLILQIFVNVDTVFEFRFGLVRCYIGEFVSFVYPTLPQARSQESWRDFSDEWSKGRETCAEDTDIQFDCGPVHDRCALTLKHEVSVVHIHFVNRGLLTIPRGITRAVITMDVDQTNDGYCAGASVRQQQSSSNVRSNAPETQAKDDHELHFSLRRNLEKHDWSDRNSEYGEVCHNIRDRVRIIYTAYSS
jgi:hypothetical protein